MERLQRPDVASAASIRTVVIVASVAAAAIHLGAVHEHLDEYVPAAVFMIASGLAQAGWAFWLRFRPSKGVLAAGALGNAGIVALWLASRTAGLPFAAERWTPEAIHATDAVATLLEVAIVLGCVALLRPTLLTLGRRYVVGVLAVSATAPFVAGEDPVHERLAAIAAVAIVAAVFMLIVVVSGASISASGRGRQDEGQQGDLGARVRDDARGSVLGARGGHTPAPRGHLDLVGR